MLVIVGLLSMFIGFIAALLAGAEWLLLSLVGLASIVVGSTLISSEVGRIINSIKRSMSDQRHDRIDR